MRHKDNDFMIQKSPPDLYPEDILAVSDIKSGWIIIRDIDIIGINATVGVNTIVGNGGTVSGGYAIDKRPRV